VIETISSRQRGTMLTIRQEIFKKIEAVVKRDTVITSNTATLMISELASVLKYPDRAVGLHFINPIEKTQIVELIVGIRTSDEAFDKILRFVKMLDRKGIKLNESPGNISTRMIIPLINEACEILMEGVASIEDIDETMSEISGNHTGPFELADRIGLDKILKYMENLYVEYGERKYMASPVIKRLVRANFLGKQTEKGFYIYENGKKVGSTVSYTVIQ
jgi:3-hydroxybutyryl-CoA dehydrogenase